MFTFILLPTFLQNAWAEDPIELPPITVTPGPSSGIVIVCNGTGYCSGLFNSTALSEQLFAETTAEIGEGGSGVFLDVRGFLSDDDTISCATEGEIRTANAGISAAPGHLFLPPDSLMRVIYSNGQSEVFIMINKFGSIPFAPIPGTCG